MCVFECVHFQLLSFVSVYNISDCLLIFLFALLPAWMIVCMPARLLVYMSHNLFVYTSACLLTYHLSACHCVCLSCLFFAHLQLVHWSAHELSAMCVMFTSWSSCMFICCCLLLPALCPCSCMISACLLLLCTSCLAAPRLLLDCSSTCLPVCVIPACLRCCISAWPFVYMSPCLLLVCLSACQSTGLLFVNLSACPLTCLLGVYVYVLFAYICFCRISTTTLSSCLNAHLSACQSVCLCVFLVLRVSCVFICMPVCQLFMYVCVSVCLVVCLSTSCLLFFWIYVCMHACILITLVITFLPRSSHCLVVFLLFCLLFNFCVWLPACLFDCLSTRPSLSFACLVRACMLLLYARLSYYACVCLSVHNVLCPLAHFYPICLLVSFVCVIMCWLACMRVCSPGLHVCCAHLLCSTVLTCMCVFLSLFLFFVAVCLLFSYVHAKSLYLSASCLCVCS